MAVSSDDSNSRYQGGTPVTPPTVIPTVTNPPASGQSNAEEWLRYQGYTPVTPPTVKAAPSNPNPSKDKGAAPFTSWPSVTTNISGWTYLQDEGKGVVHHGLDVGAPLGTPIYAPADATVDFSGYTTNGYGGLVHLTTKDGSYNVYLAHLSDWGVVKQGQQVKAGQLVGYSGTTGNSSGPHLHFEVRGANDMTEIDPYTLYGPTLPMSGAPANPSSKASASNTALFQKTGSPTPVSGPPATSNPGGSYPSYGVTSTDAGTGVPIGTINTPFGPSTITMPEIDWYKVGLFAIGALLVVVGVFGLVSGESSQMITGAVKGALKAA